MDYFESTEQFQEAFGLNQNNDYFGPVPLQDRKVGFSIKRKYPDNIRYKPAIYENGEHDNVAALWVTYTHPEESRKPINAKKVPLGVRVAIMSRYRSKHYDYDFEDEESPTEDSVEKSLSTPKPIELEYPNEFFYDHERSSFIDNNGSEITGIEILNKVFDDHCNTVHWLKGLSIRFKLLAQSKGQGVISAIVTFLTFILKKVFGRTLEESDSVSALYHGYKFDDFKKLSEDSLNIFGYKAAKSVIVLFCAFIIAIAYFRYSSGVTGGYVGFVGKSNFLSVIHGLFLLWSLDIVVPIIVFWLINGLIKVRTLIAFMKVKWP